MTEKELILKLKNEGKTREQIAQITGLSFSQVKRRLAKYKREEEEKLGRIEGSTTIEVKKDGSHISNRLLKMSEDDAKDVNFLLKAHGYDPGAWELMSARNSIWNTQDKENGVKTLYSSKITVKPLVNGIDLDTVRRHFLEFSSKFKSPTHEPTNYSSSGKMLEVNIADLHIGKLCWAGETGESYDYKIARQRFLHVINDVITRTKHYQFEKILFIFSNDFFHYDTLDATTANGTKQDTDLRWQKMYLVGLEMLIEGIDLLSKVAPVETFYVGANHDKMTSYYAINYLFAWYKDNPNVKVSVDPRSRKYYEFGNCLIGFAHGDTERKRIASLMPLEAKEAWGRTKWREIHLAHLHSEQTKEENGIIVRNLSSVTSTDGWHYEKGFVGAVKKSQTFVWDREYGLTDILHSIIMSTEEKREQS